ncbi:MAG: hypothetical protein K2O33_05105 [Muribaculaceae bacterium]|nr:hypothetical protein [Muribaculaceae bacterium]
MKKTYAALALLALILPSCDDSDQDTHHPTVYNIVELASRGEEGTTFLYYPAPGDTPVTLAARTESAVATEPGDCLFLGYTEDATPADGGATPITVKSVASILNTDARIASSDEIAGWDSEPIHLLALWRAGEKVILRCLLTADNAPRHFGLLIDEATLGDPEPTAYIYHRRDTPTPNYSSQYYTAFSLAPLLHPDGEAARPEHTALRIRVANAANPYVREITIKL